MSRTHSGRARSAPTLPSPILSAPNARGYQKLILAEGKTVEHALRIVRLFLDRNGRAILSRVPVELETRLRLEYEGVPDVGIEWFEVARAVVLRKPECHCAATPAAK